MEVLNLSLRKDSPSVANEGRHFREFVEYTASDFHKLASPAWSLEDRRIHAELEIRQELLLPSVQSHPTLPFKAYAGPGNNRDDHAALTHTVVVPDPA